MNDTFINEFRTVQQAVHVNAIKKGFWDDKFRIETLAGNVDNDKRREAAALHNNLAMIALVISELSEACEALRHGNPPDDHIPEFSGAEAEFADAIIRMMDLAALKGGGWHRPSWPSTPTTRAASTCTGRRLEHGRTDQDRLVLADASSALPA